MTINTIKALALLQFHGEPFFIVGKGDNAIAYQGNEEETFAAYLVALEDPQTDMTFEEYLADRSIEVEEYNENDYNNDYLCLTDEEADEKVKEYIKGSVWAFNADFIVDQTGLPYESAEMIKAYQEKCEGANDTILALIEKCGSFDDFCSAAVSADGRGHFISSYDGEENEETITVEGENYTFYIYRQN
jgi:hypothetical protein